MKLATIIRIGLLFLLITSFKLPVQKTFKITGNCTGFADNTLLYLDDVSDGTFQRMDSAFIYNGKFTFKGSIKGAYLKTYIRTKDFSDKCLLWLENAVIKFNGEKGNLKHAVITGSALQAEEDKLNKFLDSGADRNKQEILYIRKNPASLISANLLNIYAGSLGKEKTARLFKPFSKKLKESDFGKNIAEFLRLNKNIKIGDKYTNFQQKDVEGKMISVSDFDGKVILIEFWGSWCGPCREENPGLLKVYNEYNKKGFEILGVATETRKNLWLDAIKEDKLPWTNVSDLNIKNKAGIIYGVYYYPINFLINRKGIIVAKDVYGEALRKKILEIL